jgi:DNA-binding transcriptional MerR regulator
MIKSKKDSAFWLEPENMDLLMQSMGFLNSQQFTISDADVTHRWITYWDQEDVLLTKQVEGKWRKFSLTEFVWLKTIAKMRMFNISMPSIRAVRDSLQVDAWPHLLTPEFLHSFKTTIEQLAKRSLSKRELDDLLKKTKAELPFSCLSILIFSVLAEKFDLRIILTHDGVVTFSRNDDQNDLESLVPDLKETLAKTHLSISLQEIVLESLNSEKITAHLVMGNFISPQEEEILKVLRLEKVNSVRITKNIRTKAVDMLEYTELKEVPLKIQELILKDGYHKIEIKTKKGQVVICERTTKMKL